MLERQILEHDYEIVTAKDGRSGVAKATAERPDLIVLDLVMPGMDGLATCEALRAAETTRRTPIVVVTSLPEAQAMTSPAELGWSAHVPKPLRGPALLNAVKGLLKEKREDTRVRR